MAMDAEGTAFLIFGLFMFVTWVLPAVALLYIFYRLYRRFRPSPKPLALAFLAIASLSGIAARIGAFETAGEDHIRVIQPLERPLSDYRRARIDYTGSDRYEDCCETKMWLEEHGFYLVDDAEVVVKVEERTGLAIPSMSQKYFIPWFGDLNYKNYSFIDKQTNRKIGEIEYEKPRYKYSLFRLSGKMLDKATGMKPGLTDLSKWERVDFLDSKLSMEIPKGLRSYNDSGCRHKKGTGCIDISISMRPAMDEESGYYNEMFVTASLSSLADINNEIKQIADEADRQLTKGEITFEVRKEWLTRYTRSRGLHKVFVDVSDTNQLSGMEFRRDILDENDRVIRLHAEVYSGLPTEKHAEVRAAVRRMFESVRLL